MTVVETFASELSDLSLGRPNLELASKLTEAVKDKIKTRRIARLSRAALQIESANGVVSEILQQDRELCGPGVDYSALNQATHSLAKTVERAHKLDSRTVPYEAWMNLLHASGELYVSPCELPEPVMRSPSHRIPTWELALEVARKTVSGTPAENDPAIRQIISQPTPKPYKEVVVSYMSSDSRFPDNLDPYYRQSDEAVNTEVLLSNPGGEYTNDSTATFHPVTDMVQSETQSFVPDFDARRAA